ncbi:Beta-galactosidase BgaA [compost metagenome]
MPVLTVNKFGKGRAYYVASSPEASFLEGFLSNLCEEQGVKPLMAAPEGVEVTRRVKNGLSYLFVLNHNADPATIIIDSEKTDILTGEKVSGSLTVPGRGVAILEGTLS